ncbi:MAG: carbohydrate ABC transporter permease [Chloroflexota bacterium]
MTPKDGRPPVASTFRPRLTVGRVVLYGFIAVVLVFFIVPMLWLFTAPFDRVPTLTVSLARPTLQNFADLFRNPYTGPSLINSVVYSTGCAVIVILFASLAGYALSRVNTPGRNVILLSLLLLSSVVSGSAAIVPLYFLAFKLHLIDTALGVILIMAGGILPASIFILKDFMDSTPPSYEESARVFGATPFQILRDVVAPLVRPGIAVVGVWAFVNAWGNFLIPYVILRNPALAPAAVQIFSFQTSGGQTVLRSAAAFALIYSLPVIVLYLVVQRLYGFRFHGGIKG